MDSSFNPALESLYAARPRKFPWINVVLFLLTCFTTLFVGTMLMQMYDNQLEPPSFEFWTQPSILLKGVPFSLAIMSILFAHEMGHYLTCRYYGIDASLPYFIPFPSLVGTMGAFIRIRSPFPNRKTLLEVGIAGPIAGFVISVIVLVLSMGYARLMPAETVEGRIMLGDPLIFKAIAFLMGKLPPDGVDLYVHPIGFAAWFGFFATAMNLIPSGQLDGGHVTYALFRNYHGRISRTVAAIMLPLGFFYWPGWFLWFILLIVVRLWHPPTLQDWLPLERRHIALGWIGLIMLILCFTPNPIYIQ